MLTGFSIENFRSIRERIEVDDLQPLEVLHGENNAGKSNILSALAFAGRLMLRPDASVRYKWEPDKEYGRPGPHVDRMTDPTRIDLRTTKGQARVVVTWEPDQKIWTAETKVVGVLWPVRRLNEGREHLGLTKKTWDETLLSWYDEDLSGEGGRRSWSQLDGELQKWSDVLGAGRLDRVTLPGDPPVSELAWRTDKGRVVPFSDQGLGMRHIKDILATASLISVPGSTLMIEEPESHVSEQSLFRLRESLLLLGRQRQAQILLASHTAAFDSPHGVLRVWREDGATRIERSGDAGASSLEDPTLPERWRQAWVRLYADAGAPSAGWVTPSGILRLPLSVRASMGEGGLLCFGARSDGAFLAVPERLLTDDEGSSDAEPG